MKVWLVIGSRANWGRSRSIAEAFKSFSSVKFSIVCMGQAVDPEFGSTEQDIANDGFKPLAKIELPKVFDNHFDQATVVGIAIDRLVGLMRLERPTCVITIADRFETMATAIATSFSNIPLVHVQGGEISGNIDEKVRHAISMMADLHFPCSSKAYDRLNKMLVKNLNVYNFGCPAMDTVFKRVLKHRKLCHHSGVKKILVSFHPDTENIEESEVWFRLIFELIKKQHGTNFLLIKPNVDAGNSLLRDVINTETHHKNLTVTSGLSPDAYVDEICACDLMLGNSSSLIREAAVIGKPAVLLGRRQQGRDMAPNVVFCGAEPNLEALTDAVVLASNMKVSPTFEYGNGNAGELIARKIIEIYG